MPFDPVRKVASEPHGTLDELRRHEMNPSQHGSCSARTPTNLGCPWFAQCRFHKWKNQEEGFKGPLNVVVQIKLRQQEGGHADNKEMPCYAFYQSGLAKRQSFAAERNNGEVIRILAVEGDASGEDFSYKNRNSRSIGDPKNPRDVRVQEFVATSKLTPFKRLDDLDETDNLSAAITAEILEEKRNSPVVDVEPAKKVKKSAP